MSEQLSSEARGRTLLQLSIFLGLTFFISWSLFALLGYMPDWAERTFGTIHTPPGMVGDRSPLWYVAVYAPSLSALIVTFAVQGGGAVKALLHSYARGFRWHGLLLGIGLIPLVALVGRLVLPPDDLTPASAPGLLTAYVGVVLSLRLVFDPGPIGEELGWRGYALPRLVRLTNPFWAAIALGIIWAIWHLNGFVGPNPVLAKNFTFAAFATGCVSATVIMTWLYMRYRGNVLICGVAAHLALNAMIEAGISRLETATILAMSAFAIALVIFDPSMRPFTRARLTDREDDGKP